MANKYIKKMEREWKFRFPYIKTLKIYFHGLLAMKSSDGFKISKKVVKFSAIVIAMT